MLLTLLMAATTAGGFVPFRIDIDERETPCPEPISGVWRTHQGRALPEPTTRVRFKTGRAGAMDSLEVDSTYEALFGRLSSVLVEEGVLISGSSIRAANGRVHAWFNLSEVDGSPIGEERRLAVQNAILASLDGLEVPACHSDAAG